MIIKIPRKIRKKNPSNIGDKVPDKEWRITRQNVRPRASNKNPYPVPRNTAASEIGNGVIFLL